MLAYLQKKPNLQHFELMEDWEEVPSSEENIGAKHLYETHSIVFSFDQISESRNKTQLLAFLRYDYKKVLIRTRFLYVDRFFSREESKLIGTDLDFGFFEPILICFPNLEFLGRIMYPALFNPPGLSTKKILRKMLGQMDEGYKRYATSLINWHRHALSHELRPDGNWGYDLNTETDYRAPHMTVEDKLCLNIPHFIDACIIEIEKLCDKLTSVEADVAMDLFCQYCAKRPRN